MVRRAPVAALLCNAQIFVWLGQDRATNSWRALRNLADFSSSVSMGSWKGVWVVSILVKAANVSLHLSCFASFCCDQEPSSYWFMGCWVKFFWPMLLWKHVAWPDAPSLQENWWPVVLGVVLQCSGLSTLCFVVNRNGNFSACSGSDGNTSKWYHFSSLVIHEALQSLGGGRLKGVSPTSLCWMGFTWRAIEGWKK